MGRFNLASWTLKTGIGVSFFAFRATWKLFNAFVLFPIVGILYIIKYLGVGFYEACKYLILLNKSIKSQEDYAQLSAAADNYLAYQARLAELREAHDVLTAIEHRDTELAHQYVEHYAHKPLDEVNFDASITAKLAKSTPKPDKIIMGKKIFIKKSKIHSDMSGLSKIREKMNHIDVSTLAADLSAHQASH